MTATTIAGCASPRCFRIELVWILQNDEDCMSKASKAKQRCFSHYPQLVPRQRATQGVSGPHEFELVPVVGEAD